MRKIFYKTLAIALVLVGLCFPSFAEGIDVSDEVESLRYYFYNQGADIETLKSYGTYGFTVLNSIQFFRSGQDFTPLLTSVEDNTLGKAQRLLEQLAFDMEPSGYEQLRQQEDGSFADCGVQENIYCFTVLEAAQKRLEKQNRVAYSSKSAKSWLLSQQQPNGSFADDPVTTAQALSYLSVFEETEAMERGAAYIQSQLHSLQTVTEIADVICGLVDAGVSVQSGDYNNLPAVLAGYKHEDRSFGDQNDSLHALAAFDSLATQTSPMKKLMLNGSFSENLLEQLAPVLIVYGVAALIAVVVWLYILFGRKKVRQTNSESIFKNPKGMTREQLKKEIEESE